MCATFAMVFSVIEVFAGRNDLTNDAQEKRKGRMSAALSHLEH
jgi:hypothetical protein